MKLNFKIKIKTKKSTDKVTTSLPSKNLVPVIKNNGEMIVYLQKKWDFLK